MKKESKYERVFPIIWNQYEFLFRSLKNYENKFQLLLAISSIIILIFFSFELQKKHILFYLPLVGFMISTFVCLYYIVPRRYWVPWIEKEQMLQKFKNNEDPYEFIFNDIYGVTKYIRIISKKYKKFILISINSIIISIFLSVIIFSFLANDLLLASIFLIFLAIIIFWINKIFDTNIGPKRINLS